MINPRVVLASLAVLTAACTEPAPQPQADAEPAAARALTAIPEPFTGEWNADLAACGTQDSDSRLRIAPAELTFYESGGTVGVVAAQGPSDVSVTAAMSGEGESWTAEYRFTLSPDGQTLTTSYSGAPPLDRRRCP